MTPIAEPTTDEDFEAEVRAMLARRAGDVSPSPAPAVRGEMVAVAGAPATPRRARHRVVAAAAAVAVVIGAATYLVAHEPAGPSTTTAAAPEAEPIVWPLHDDVTADVLAAPETAAAAYLAEVVPDVAVPPTLEAPVVDADRATVSYRLGDIPGRVDLRRDGPGWGVVAASSDAVRIDAAPVANGRVEAMTVLGDAVETDMVLRTSAVDASGNATVHSFTAVVLVATEDGVQLEPTTGSATTLVLSPDDPEGRSIALELPLAGSSPPAAVRVDVLAPDDGDPATPEVVVAHATHAVDGPGGEDEPHPPTTSTIVDSEPEVDTDENVVDGPGEETPADVVPPSGATAGGIHVEGTYRGDERFGFTAGDCPDLDHELHSTFTLTDGTTWPFQATYCGDLDGDQWSGEGTFTFTTPGGDTITGTLTTAATLPTEGVPYDLAITGGTGAYAGATGACSLDNHVEPREALGAQRQSGSFVCDIGGTASTSP